MLGKRIKTKRQELGLTQSQLGELVSVSKVSICNWEKGIKNPSSENLIVLSKQLNTSIDYLIGNDFYVVAEGIDQYGLSMAKDEIELIKELRRHIKLYEMVIDDPKRTFDLIDRKIL